MFHRRSVRLPNFDYGHEGWYYVTICVHKRRKIFGEVINDAMVPNAMGRAVAHEWLRTPSLRPDVDLDEYVVMPNHFHGIVRIVHGMNAQGVCNTPLRSPTLTMGAIVRGFKSAVTAMGKQCAIVPDGKIWQRNYYEHIIRDADDLERIRAYIRDNPRNWQRDTLA